MLFTDHNFVLLLAVTLSLYYLIQIVNYQIGVLIGSSFIFYAYNNPKLLILLCISIFLNSWIASQILFSSVKKRRLKATIGVVLNLLLLSFFKYGSLFGMSFLNTQWQDFGEFLISIPLPIGISFFTFEGISLVVDAYKSPSANTMLGNKTNKVSIYPFTTLFVSFFPHLIAGPILKAHEFFPQIISKSIRDVDWSFCIKNLIIGYFFKLVVADNLKDQTFFMAYPYFLELSSFQLITMLIGYSFQIFSDFAGYSSIALGLAGLFGYRLQQNFNFPYISSSFSEFWRRWHISLSVFLKEYLYIPLGGNRYGQARTYINLAITMILGGLWHGAAWSYAVWGAWHGLLLSMERFINDRFEIQWFRGGRYLKTIFVFFMISLAWLLFKLPNFDHVVQYLYLMISKFNLPQLSELNYFYFVLTYGLPVIVYHFIYLLKIKAKPISVRYEHLLYGLMLFLILTNSGTSGSFIYFQF